MLQHELAEEHVQNCHRTHLPQIDTGQNVPAPCKRQEMVPAFFHGLQAGYFPAVRVWLRKWLQMLLQQAY